MNSAARHLAVLGATGATGQLLVTQALARGHTVTVMARNPARLELPDSDRVLRVVADVHDPASITAGLTGVDVLLSGLGATKGDPGATLSAGAHAVIDAGGPRIIWLGAFGTGPSADTAGALTRTILALALHGELRDKVDADTAVLRAGGTVFHAGPLTRGVLSPTRRTLTLAEVPRRLFPRSVSRATVAAAMLDEAESACRPGRLLVPVS